MCISMSRHLGTKHLHMTKITIETLKNRVNNQEVRFVKDKRAWLNKSPFPWHILLFGGPSATNCIWRAVYRSSIIASILSFLGVEITVRFSLFSSINMLLLSSNCGHTNPDPIGVGRLGLLKSVSSMMF